MSQNSCNECGTEILRPDQAFCGMCGASLNGGVQDSSPFNPFAYSFSGRPYEGFTEEAFTHRQKSLVLVQSTAERWFGGEQVPATKAAKKCSRELPGWLDEATIDSQFLDGAELFLEYESILWSDSRFGERFLQAMNSRGASISHGYIGRQASFVNEKGETELIPLSTPIDLYNGRWALSDGSEFLQNGQIFRSKKSGQEIVYWSIDAFARTRPSISGFAKDLTNQVAIPYYLQTAAYLAETPFPSALTGSMMMIPRSSTFGEGNLNPPRPAIRTVANGIALSISNTKDGKAAISFWTPELTQFGYIFTEDMSDEEIYEALPGVCDNLPKVLEIIVDGYANWPEESEISFQDSLIADICFRDGEENFKFGAIVPGALYGNISLHHNEIYNDYFKKLEQALSKRDSDLIDDCLSVFDLLAHYGIGSISIHSANTLASTLLELDIDGEIDSLLEYFVEIDVDYQNVNALSNLILTKMARGDYDSANSLLPRALDICKNKKINLDTLSHDTPWDGSVEDSIITEIFESAMAIYTRLEKKSDLKKIAQQIIGYCQERKIKPPVLKQALSLQ